MEQVASKAAVRQSEIQEEWNLSLGHLRATVPVQIGKLRARQGRGLPRPIWKGPRGSQAGTEVMGSQAHGRRQALGVGRGRLKGQRGRGVWRD